MASRPAVLYQELLFAIYAAEADQPRPDALVASASERFLGISFRPLAQVRPLDLTWPPRLHQRLFLEAAVHIASADNATMRRAAKRQRSPAAARPSPSRWAGFVERSVTPESIAPHRSAISSPTDGSSSEPRDGIPTQSPNSSMATS